MNPEPSHSGLRIVVVLVSSH